MAKQPTPKIVTKKHLARQEREQIQNRYIVIASAIILVLVLGLIGFGILDQTVLQARQPVAKVGNDAITSSSFQAQVRYSRYQLIQQYKSIAQIDKIISAEWAVMNRPNL